VTVNNQKEEAERIEPKKRYDSFGDSLREISVLLQIAYERSQIRQMFIYLAISNAHAHPRKLAKDECNEGLG
jgi:hypothetical protein